MNERWDVSNLGSGWARVWGVVGEGPNLIYPYGRQELEDRNASGFVFNPSERRLSSLKSDIQEVAHGTPKFANQGCVMECFLASC